MGKSVLASIVALSLWFGGMSLPKVVDHTSASVIRVTGIKTLTDPREIYFNGGKDTYPYACTGFMVRPKEFLTAAHCISKTMFGDGVKVTTILKVDDYFDLALVELDTNKPALELRLEPVERFEEATGVGYGFGFGKLLVTRHLVTLVDYTPEPDLAPGIWFSNTFIGGMSGGPVVDNKGRVIAVIQRGGESAGYGVNTLTMRVFLLGTD